jgi:hypothetical protein
MPFIATLLTAALLANPKITFNTTKEVKKDRYEINLTYVTFSPNTSLNKLANKLSAAAVQKSVKEFRDAGIEFDEAPTAPWSHEAGCTVSLSTTSLISVLIDKYEYAGGAHPNTWTNTINVALINGKPKQLTLKDILAPAATESDILDVLVLPRVSEQRKNRSGETVDFLPDDTNKKFLISKNGLTFIFDKYSVASYAEGEFLVKLTWQDLKGLVNHKIIPSAVP